MAKIKIQNIKSHDHGAANFPGIRSVTLDVNEGEYLPDHDEGVKYPTGADNVGTREGQWPVSGEVESEDANAILGLISAARDDSVVTGQAHGSNANQVFTISNAKYQSVNNQIQRQRDGMYRARFHAFSDDGDALPLTIEDEV